MATNPINLGNGADLLQLFGESQGTPAAAPAQASAKVLKLAIAQAELSAEQLIGGDIGSKLNVYG